MSMRYSKTPSAEFVYNCLQVYSSNPGNSLAFAVPEAISPPPASDPAMAADAPSFLSRVFMRSGINFLERCVWVAGGSRLCLALRPVTRQDRRLPSYPDGSV